MSRSVFEHVTRFCSESAKEMKKRKFSHITNGLELSQFSQQQGGNGGGAWKDDCESRGIHENHFTNIFFFIVFEKTRKVNLYFCGFFVPLRPRSKSNTTAMWKSMPNNARPLIVGNSLNPCVLQTGVTRHLSVEGEVFFYKSFCFFVFLSKRLWEVLDYNVQMVNGYQKEVSQKDKNLVQHKHSILVLELTK